VNEREIEKVLSTLRADDRVGLLYKLMTAVKDYSPRVTKVNGRHSYEKEKERETERETERERETKRERERETG